MTADTGSSRELREAVERVIVHHRTVADERPWDVADAVLALPEIAALIGLRERVEALIDPENGMAIGNGYNADRLFTEREIRAALDARP
jgi:hypothetical protein